LTNLSHDASKVVPSNAVSERQFCRSTKLRDKIAQPCHMSDIGLTSF